MKNRPISKIFSLIIKVIILLSLFLFIYYLLYIKSNLIISENLIKTEKILNEQKNYISQSRITFIELIKLDPKSPNFVLEKRNEVKTLNEINEKALIYLENPYTYPKIFIKPKKYSNFLGNELKEKMMKLRQKNKNFFIEQKEFFSKLETINFQDQTEFLKSAESIKLLTKQTNLILEHQFLLDKINYYQNKLIQ
ncbi:MAG: hypothetical protein A2725_00020 [Candidatus Magasanikbacteria bacterium RIFCSPHIGHO2_01_FULL_33_34]|uniref:Uncharacterized protein n=1 Tax=Candidatus Magasanikbacteria bacterium RIFCSPHIGHO2_01_FULL_33_34 TaxID=1798671 RepID=A0A1F6LL50_9BACT|nr:MAG: hypothetical protein A2725_00020 [Candidatus Magasanikbacteria bacterium RIFCSPHIGHO2_01_FULL_33_34]OGH65746.1 MAG: hypothetical protein A3B83_02690 [Candidatus Magasanikbacteria bacterium RIFCSPHIGHO2_02_FULL_33_17]OGH75112.1 MAG: hypothetical protein A3A89_03285 [Candidatus Magasanikbacteria bacterium RIFCSPLOWO2_01_FULL_33_34]OGH81190.1 MAG: hypothetical protein A3F93_03985 [Candidatus Magasanikbacteria bacterium RIFCSPLOWO2_12_FULL_34_7]